MGNVEIDDEFFYLFREVLTFRRNLVLFWAHYHFRLAFEYFFKSTNMFAMCQTHHPILAMPRF